jgi:hypothetical protein
VLDMDSSESPTDAKANTVHGDFQRMLENDLDFKPRVAQRLMAVAKDERLTNPTHASLLPQAWTTLYELTSNRAAPCLAA